jgi:hypothetical protein
MSFSFPELLIDPRDAPLRRSEERPGSAPGGGLKLPSLTIREQANLASCTGPFSVMNDGTVLPAPFLLAGPPTLASARKPSG